IVFEAIDRKTGLRPASFCKWRFMEAFLDGTEPMRYCSLEDHLLVLNYDSDAKGKEERER
ncbi:MAG: hypothetical protein NTZ26_13650, partial [Candidatus Aminicenantes bacterium]|nr:hypothetical protein [Candidatus Aminicenantes bacterium]